MSAINGLSVSDFANAIKVLGRSSQASAGAASQRADQVPDNSRRLGQEVNNDGFVSGGEMYEFARLTGGIGQGLSAAEKRLGQATRILYQALYEAPAQNMLLYSNAPPAPWRKEVPIAGMTGTVQVKDVNGRVVLETDRKMLAQRLAGAGQPKIGPDDFQAALVFLTPNERYLANALLNELYFSAPLQTTRKDSATPGGRPMRLETVHSGSGEVPTGGYSAGGRKVTYAVTAAHTIELTLKPREVLINTGNGETFTPDRSGKVRLPVGSRTELAVVTRGATGGVKEKFVLELAGVNEERGNV